MQASKRVLSRRDALKTLAALSGAVALSSLPNKWNTPLVEVGALPAHAQCTPSPSTGAVFILNTTNGRVDLSLEPREGPILRISVGPFDVGCLDRITPGPYLLCYEIVGGSCPAKDCAEVEIYADSGIGIGFTCQDGIGGAEVTIERR